MTLALIFSLMTAAAIFAVLWPLARNVPRQAGSDLAVYKDQLEEVERDRAAGRIGAVEANAARIEVSRRLLAADAVSSASKAPAATQLWRRRAVALAALIVLPFAAAILYLTLGSPLLP